MFRGSDREASERFYDTVLSVLGKPRAGSEEHTAWGDFDIGWNGPATRNLHGHNVEAVNHSR